MITPIIAGTYFREDILEGSTKAALLALVMLIPILCVRKRELFNTAASVFAGLAAAYVVFGISMGAMCPHYWEVALPFFLALGVAVLGAVRWSINRRVDGALIWYATMVFTIGLPCGISWISDIHSVVSGARKTRADFQARMTARSEQGEQGGADPPAAAPESKPESDSQPKPESEGRSR